MLSSAFDRCLLLIYNAQEEYFVLDQAPFPSEFSVQIVQIPRGKAGLGMKGEASHVMEEDGDERKDKRCETFSGIERGCLKKER